MTSKYPAWKLVLQKAPRANCWAAKGQRSWRPRPRPRPSCFSRRSRDTEADSPPSNGLTWPEWQGPCAKTFEQSDPDGGGTWVVAVHRLSPNTLPQLSEVGRRDLCQRQRRNNRRTKPNRINANDATTNEPNPTESRGSIDTCQNGVARGPRRLQLGEATELSPSGRDAQRASLIFLLLGRAPVLGRCTHVSGDTR